ncbi:MAG: fructosamine kinase family protein [Vicinamibacteria bacterium]
MRFLEAALERALGLSRVTVRRATAVSGGCIHEARRLATSEGEFFAKWSASCPADIFVSEAAGLEALRSTASEIVVPQVIAAGKPAGGDPAFLILEYLEPSDPGQVSDEEKLGLGLAAIHRARTEKFGFDSPTYCGLTRQDNQWRDSWVHFYRDQRLAPLVDTLSRERGLPPSDRRRYERVMDRLPELLPKDSPPSLIHGDLWSGNVLFGGNGPALVDPACAYADREMEFGIATLFGGLSPRAWRAYEEAWPLPEGWRDRNPLYQLYHLLNHAVLFGGHYADDARAIALRYVS